MIRIDKLENTPLIWATLSTESLYKELEIGIILRIAHLLSHFLASTFIPSLALEPISFGF